MRGRDLERRKEIAGVRVSWHAMVRYLERFKKRDLRAIKYQYKKNDYKVMKHLEREEKLDLDKLADEMVNDKIWSMLYESNYADGVYRSGKDKVVVQKGIIVTVARENIDRKYRGGRHKKFRRKGRFDNRKGSR